jgi:hypothetical protein
MAQCAASVSGLARSSASLLLLVVAASLLAGASAWKEGRATFYGNEPWGWSIHFGSELTGITRTVLLALGGALSLLLHTADYANVMEFCDITYFTQLLQLYVTSEGGKRPAIYLQLSHCQG